MIKTSEEDDLKYAICCPVCYEEYDKPRFPRIILSPGCGHSICSRCLPHLLGTTYPACPICRKPCSLNLLAYPINIDLREVCIDSVQHRKLRAFFKTITIELEAEIEKLKERYKDFIEKDKIFYSFSFYEFENKGKDKPASVNVGELDPDAEIKKFLEDSAKGPMCFGHFCNGPPSLRQFPQFVVHTLADEDLHPARDDESAYVCNWQLVDALNTMNELFADNMKIRQECIRLDTFRKKLNDRYQLQYEVEQQMNNDPYVKYLRETTKIQFKKPKTLFSLFEPFEKDEEEGPPKIRALTARSVNYDQKTPEDRQALVLDVLEGLVNPNTLPPNPVYKEFLEKNSLAEKDPMECSIPPEERNAFINETLTNTIANLLTFPEFQDQFAEFRDHKGPIWPPDFTSVTSEPVKGKPK